MKSLGFQRAPLIGSPHRHPTGLPLRVDRHLFIEAVKNKHSIRSSGDCSLGCGICQNNRKIGN
ncbi:hypothetical protein N7448_000841 [Penicillium atrosanguineum]|uniref:Uncharacterized protein n=1 Tax=Penicillium atrosanguineum TaxID=1132637 RepID=A0A9W9LBF8_9EURO|nr:uncharacterized protein N7443_004236 [Penicillium atrosanguineum]KAJ5134136.1 hypothetical protein N7526_005501 [Penicillium atrosanguineum]KAJ5149263.1 hypothetical protein N7448_000841 [Penicillium atrosanguineum]KAJ5304576.1 hypothetical protein N7443_004236 [Penicillium atrosanguineum]KAJ5324045.1 hypothetical protein N7476_002645 [Penicillium atrosanguineum]